MAKKEIDKIVTPVFRVSFPQVFEAKSFEGAKPKFSIVMLFKKNENLQTMKELAKRALFNKWGNDLPPNLNTPFRDGNSVDYDGYENIIYAPASSQYQPGIVDEQKQTLIDPKQFYAGCYAIASVNAYAYDVAGNKGVSFGLQNLMKMNDGEPLTGGATAEQDFESIPLPEGAATEGKESVLDIGL